MSMLGRLFGFGRNQDYDLGIRLFDEGRYADAINALEQVTRAGGRAPDVLTQRLASFYIAEAHGHMGVAALEQGDAESARDALGRALALNPHYADLHFHFGRASRQDGDLPQALHAFDQALCINGRYAKAHLHRGLTLYVMGRREEGVGAIRQALELERGYQGALADQALAAHGAEEWAAAQALWHQVAEMDVDNIAHHAGLASDLYRRGLYAQSVEAFREALALNPNYPDLRNGLGTALHACGDLDGAIEQFRRALEINPRYSDARANLAHALRASGRDEEAHEEFARMVDDARTGALMIHEHTTG